MTSSPLVTVLVPSYNHERFVIEAINSLLNQTYGNLEIIVIDDGSSDNSAAVLKSIPQDSRIKLILREANLGGSYSSNEAIRLARGKYFGILSSDDVCHPEKIEAQVQILEANPALGATFSMAGFIDEQGETISRASPFHFLNQTRHEWLRHFFYRGNCLCHPSALIRTAIFSKTGPYELVLSSLGDFDMWIRLAGVAEIHVTPEELVSFRILDREQNASGDNPGNRQAAMHEWLFILHRFFNYCNSTDFPRIFPNIGLDCSVNNDYEFLLSLEAARQTSSPHRAFGLANLYRIMSDTPRMENIERMYSFGTKQLIALSRATDTFQGEQLKRVSADFFDVSSRLSDLESSRPVIWARKVRAIQRRALGPLS